MLGRPLRACGSRATASRSEIGGRWNSPATVKTASAATTYRLHPANRVSNRFARFAASREKTAAMPSDRTTSLVGWSEMPLACMTPYMASAPKMKVALLTATLTLPARDRAAGTSARSRKHRAADSGAIQTSSV